MTSDDDETPRSWWVTAQAHGKREDFYRALAQRRAERARKFTGPPADATWPKQRAGRMAERIQGIR